MQETAATCRLEENLRQEQVWKSPAPPHKHLRLISLKRVQMEKVAEVPRSGVAGRVPGKLARKSLAGVLMTLGGKTTCKGTCKTLESECHWVFPTENQSRESSCWPGSHCRQEKAPEPGEAKPLPLVFLTACDVSTGAVVGLSPGVRVWQPNSHYNTVKRWDFEEMIGSTLTSGLMLLSEWGCGNKDVFGPRLMHVLSCPASAVTCDQQEDSCQVWAS